MSCPASILSCEYPVHGAVLRVSFPMNSPLQLAVMRVSYHREVLLVFYPRSCSVLLVCYLKSFPTSILRNEFLQVSHRYPIQYPMICSTSILLTELSCKHPVQWAVLQESSPMSCPARILSNELSCKNNIQWAVLRVSYPMSCTARILSTELFCEYPIQ